MKTPKNKYLIAFEKEQKLGNLYVPIHKGEEETVLRPVKGIVKALPMLLTKQFGIASNTGAGTLNALLLADSLKKLELDSVVYVGYMATDKDNFLYSDEQYDYYVVPVHQLVAMDTDSGLQAIAGKVLIRPLQKAEFESKVLISPHSIKDLGFGEIISCSEGMPEYYKSGQIVAYLEKFAEWIEIGGEKYDFVYTGEILALINEKI